MILRIDLAFDGVVMMVTLMFLQERALEMSSNGRVRPCAMRGKITTRGINGCAIPIAPLTLPPRGLIRLCTSTQTQILYL